MRILLINPSLRPTSPVKLFPVGLGYVATAARRAGYDFDLLDVDAHRPGDAEVDAAIGAEDYDVVCLGTIVTGYRIVKDLAARIRARHPRAVIVVGNTVASSIPRILLERTEADVAVMGEADVTIVHLLGTIARGGALAEVPGICFLERGRLVRTAERPIVGDLDRLPWIDFDLFDVETYAANAPEQLREPLPLPRREARQLPINTARGCIASCTFCYHAFKGRRYRTRTPGSVVAEAAQLIDRYGVNFIAFSDELTFYSRKQALAFADAIIASGLRFYWVGNCRAGLFGRDEDIAIIQRMKEAGCLGGSYSLESADPGILKAMNKCITLGQFRRQTELFQRAGLPVWTSLVFGYPQETRRTIQQTFDVCIEHGIYPSSGFLLPQPGSVMYDYARERGLIPDEERYLLALGDRQDLRLNLTGMPDGELEAAVREGAMRCSEALGLGLREESLIKTQYYRSGRERTAA